MSLVDENALAEQLRQSVDSIQLAGPGPDLSRIRRRGAGRRRRHQAAVAGSVAAVIATAGTLAVTVDRYSDGLTSGYAGPAPSEQTSNPAEVTALMDASLRQAGITFPEKLAVAGQDGETSEPILWSKHWSITASSPKLAINFTVEPQGRLPEDAYPCRQGAPDQVRSCTDEVLDNGVRLLSGEDSGGGIVNGTNRWTMWSPSALAVYPDGRQVAMNVGLLMEEGDPIPPGVVVEDYPGPVTLEQLRQVVSDPALAEIALAD